MNIEFFIAKRIHFSKDKDDNRRVTPPVIRIAMAGIAIGLAVMIVSVAVVVGFKTEVREKVIGFGSHIQLSKFDSNFSYESTPIAVSDSLRKALLHTAGVKRIETFATKPGVIKTETDFHGVVLKGVDVDFDTTFLKSHLVEGQMIHIDSVALSSQILISRYTANLLRLTCGESINMFFLSDQNDRHDYVRARKFQIAGIYDTSFSDYDKLFAIGDIKLIRRINGWDDDMVSCVAIFIDNYDQLDIVTDELYFALLDEIDRLGNNYYVRSITELNPMIFNWLAILDSNVVIILTLMIIVSGFTMISGLLIIILERTNMIGILKALGENNFSIRKIFLYISFFLIIKGMIWGNIIGLTLCFLESHFHFLKLDPEIYYMNWAPIDLKWLYLLLINTGSLLAALLMMILPSYLITKIEPAKSIKYE